MLVKLLDLTMLHRDSVLCFIKYFISKITNENYMTEMCRNRVILCSELKK